MKKIISLALLLAMMLMLCVSCRDPKPDDGNDVDDGTTDDGNVDSIAEDIASVVDCYGRSYPHKIVVTSTQQFGAQSLNSTTEITRGTIGSEFVAKKVAVLERLRSIADGSGVDVYGPVETVKEELWFRVGKGLSSDKGETWDAEGENFFPDKGTFALNLNPDLMSDVVYKNGSLSFKVVRANTKAFFGDDTSITGDATVVISTGGGFVTEVRISWSKPENVATGVELTTVSLKASYIYDQQKVTFD